MSALQQCGKRPLPVNWIMYVLAAAAGAANPAQAGANAELKKSLDQLLTATVCVYLSGLVGVLVIFFVSRQAIPCRGQVVLGSLVGLDRRSAEHRGHAGRSGICTADGVRRFHRNQHYVVADHVSRLGQLRLDRFQSTPSDVAAHARRRFDDSRIMVDVEILTDWTERGAAESVVRSTKIRYRNAAARHRPRDSRRDRQFPS